MKIYNQINGFDAVNPVVTIGIFDGIHLGHRQIIQRIKEIALHINGETVMVTFWPHPRIVLKKNNMPVKLLTALEEKTKIIETLGIDHLIVLPFTPDFANTTFNEFIHNYLVNGLHSKYIVIGYNHHFGKDRQGGFDQLKENADRYGFTVERLNPVIIEDTVVSSSNIRNLISNGNPVLANKLLGYPYFITGKVTEGKKIGRKIGFPTANVTVTDENKLIPFTGVYAVRVELNRTLYNGMLNIGIRPTINSNNHHLTIEVHIFDFNKDIYGHEITLQFLDRIRNEKKFNNIEELVEQLKNDKIKAGLLLDKFSEK